MGLINIDDDQAKIVEQQILHLLHFALSNIMSPFRCTIQEAINSYKISTAGYRIEETGRYRIWSVVICDPIIRPQSTGLFSIEIYIELDSSMSPLSASIRGLVSRGMLKDSQGWQFAPYGEVF